ncbi:hypothetical protein [Gallibacterium anatis]|uniref:hypothetical protein n=1 Tax=Gallibacterium anatis TaxID=750 RepID=UPI0005321380|nr:hypothetical protein [Gallibacterium anatis]KGQ63007.1 hypothetical protein IO49_11270 [Gallibacterium anatis]
MIIKTIAIGNNEESYIEKRISDGVNIILSDDNNKGKTILIQSMFYAIGNNPIFPDSFDYKKYYYYLKFMHNSKEYEVVRKGDSFIIQTDNSLHMFDGISELKRYWTKEIFNLPEFQFHGKQHLSDMELFIQLFFVGQDAKNTSNIFNSGYYHKDDFKNMLLSYSGVSVVNISSDDERRIKRELKLLRAARKDKLDLSDFYKSHSAATEYISHIKDKDAFNQKVADMESIRENISQLRKARSKSASKKALWNSTLKELNSLNRNIEVGELRCMDCDSTNITYKGQGKDSYSFDVSTPEMRKHIINSIKEKIANFSEDISRYDAEIEKYQIEFNRVMKEDDVTIENIVAFKSGFTSIEEIDSAITEIDNQITELQGELDTGAKISEEAKKKRQEFFQKFMEDMNAISNFIEGTTDKKYNDFFTKSGAVISGSEETVFYISKLLATANATKHECPIVMDSFRAEDLSTEKENRALDLFLDLNKQCILTTTIKKEEKGKYNNFPQINIVDYTNHTTNKLLNPDYNDEFISILGTMNILLK